MLRLSNTSSLNTKIKPRPHTWFRFLFSATLLLTALLIADSLHEGLASSTQFLWLSGAITIGLMFLIGPQSLLGSCIGFLIFEHIQGYPLGKVGAYAGALYLTSLGLCLFAPYLTERSHNKHIKVLSTSARTAKFLILIALASLVSTSLLNLTLSIASASHSLSLNSLASDTVSSALYLFCICPALIKLSEGSKEDRLNDLVIEYIGWTFALILISFLATLYGREFFLAAFALVIWATARFSFFGASLAILITTAFVSPQTHAHSLVDNGLLAWLFSNIEPIIWIGVSATSLYFASLLSDLKDSEHLLESRVLSRTQELDSINKTLQAEIVVRQQAETSLKQSNKRYRALIETAGIPIIVINDNYVIEHWNSAAEACFGYRYDMVLGRSFVYFCLPDAQQEAFLWRLDKASASGINQENIECEVLTSKQAKLTMLWNINHISNDELEENGQFLLIGQNISEIRKTQNQLHYLAHFDSLTGASNRRLFEDRCKQAIASANRYDRQIALVSIDIDHFKRINDTLGHDAGDTFLSTLSKRLSECVRQEDTIARLGGDEFAILLANVSGREGAERVARNILERITETITLRNVELVVTSSIGITLSPDDGLEYDELLKNADLAMYRAKKAGRNNIQFYCREMHLEMQRQLSVEQELRTALQNDEFVMHYQPIIDTKSGEIVALEALIRWKHPEKGLVYPDEFIHVADQTGLLQQIGHWAINTLCHEGSAIQREHNNLLPISFNLTSRQYNHPGLIKMLQDACEKENFNPKSLILELSENTITNDAQNQDSILDKIKELGSAIAIDGFGTGLSSLRQLNQLPVDIIKIDRSFIQGITNDKNDKAITETLLTVANQLGLKTFASGVETKAQENFLQKNGCHYAQGYLYARALPLEHLYSLFASSQKGTVFDSGDQITLPFSNRLFEESA
jgi:diguanylate cyclase (GGDEF)-like protein/PAS domain S-box-containing protein